MWPTFARVAPAWLDGQGFELGQGTSGGDSVRQLSKRLKRLEAAFPAVSEDPFGDAMEFASRSLSTEDAGRAFDAALNRASDADLRFLLAHFDPTGRGEPPTPADRSTLYRLGETVRAGRDGVR
jgi:hypothetical protein